MRHDSGNPLTRWLDAIQFIAVLALLATVAGLLIPRVTHGAGESRDATLADCLRYLRTQIQVYAVEHDNVCPGFPNDDGTQSPDAVTLVAQLTGFTDHAGKVSDTRSGVYSLGPYISSLPGNPITLRDGVLVVVGQVMPTPDESQPFGWFYSPRAGRIIANVVGADSEGVAYSDY